MPLTDEQRRHLEARLLEERARTVRILERHAGTLGVSEQEESGDLSHHPLHLADEGTDTFDRELEASLATRASRELADIDAALQRFYAEPGRFGVCEDTGREIPFERLDLVPWARRCEEPVSSERSGDDRGKPLRK